MKVILAVNVICPPLTGIGRYALELAHRIPGFADVEAMRYYSLGGWVPDVDALVQPPSAMTAGRRLSGFLRAWATGQRSIVWAYRYVMPILDRWQLRNCSDYLFHSPNYFVPPFPGPAVATVFDLSAYRYPETHPKARVDYLRYELPLSLERTTLVITAAQTVRDEVVATFGFPSERIAVVPLGVSEHYFPRSLAEAAPVVRQYGLNPGEYTLCVSTIEPRKKVDRLLDAYGCLPQAQRQRFPLVVIGGRGWLSDIVHARLREAESQGWARYLGYVPEMDLPLLYSGARLFCFPSIYEGYGLPVLEAMASGIPVITSNKSCLPEVANGAALLIDPDDVDTFRESLQKGLTDDSWRTDAIKSGLTTAREKTWSRCAQETIEVYKRAAA